MNSFIPLSESTQSIVEVEVFKAVEVAVVEAVILLLIIDDVEFRVVVAVFTDAGQIPHRLLVQHFPAWTQQS